MAQRKRRALSKRVRERLKVKVAEFNENKEEIFKLVPKGDKAELFDKIAERINNPRDILLRSNRGRYYEMFFKVIVGEIQTVQDVMDFDPFESEPHTKQGDINIGGQAFQIKGPGSNINIYNPQDIRDSQGEVTVDKDKKGSLERVLKTYHEAGVPGWRYGVGFGSQYYGAMLDIGTTLMMETLGANLENFKFLRNRDKRKTREKFDTILSEKPMEKEKIAEALKKTYEEIKGNAADIALLKEIAAAAGIRGLNRDDVIAKIIRQILDIDYSLEFNPDIRFAQRMVGDYGAVVRTALGPDDDKKPFYDLLEKLGVTPTKPNGHVLSGYFKKTGNFFNKTYVNKTYLYYIPSYPAQYY